MGFHGGRDSLGGHSLRDRLDEVRDLCLQALAFRDEPRRRVGRRIDDREQFLEEARPKHLPFDDAEDVIVRLGHRQGESV